MQPSGSMDLQAWKVGSRLRGMSELEVCTIVLFSHICKASPSFFHQYVQIHRIVRANHVLWRGHSRREETNGLFHFDLQRLWFCIKIWLGLICWFACWCWLRILICSFTWKRHHKSSSRILLLRLILLIMIIQIILIMAMIAMMLMVVCHIFSLPEKKIVPMALRSCATSQLSQPSAATQQLRNFRLED